MAVPSYIEKFVSIDAGTSYTFGTNLMRITVTQNVRVPMAVAIGGDYAHDFNGWGVSARDVETIGLQWMIVKSTAALVDTEVDLCRSKLLLIGKGKLYALFADATERWCYARISSMPSSPRTGNEFTSVPMAVGFIRTSNWRATTQATGTQSVTTTGTQSFTITNAGNAYVRDAVCRLRANAWHGWVTPAIRNATTGEWLYSARQAESADAELKIDASAQGVYYSGNDGATYADDYSRVSRGPQGGLFSLAPGANTIVSIGGDQWPLLSLMNPAAQNYSFEWAYDTQYA